MATNLRSKLPNTGPSYLWSSDWQLMMEMHIAYMHRNGLVDIFSISPSKAYKFEGDFWGLLIDENIPFESHWVILRLNNLRNPADFTSDMTTILVPVEGTVGSYNGKYRASVQNKK